MDQDAVEEGAQCFGLGSVDPHGRVQHLCEEGQQRFVAVGQPEAWVFEDPVVVPVEIEQPVLAMSRLAVVNRES
ncbi:hypothetical protein GCM10010149_91860 [Nonomuraea roseoviolacea subsp. roseoviolacea]